MQTGLSEFRRLPEVENTWYSWVSQKRLHLLMWLTTPWNSFFNQQRITMHLIMIHKKYMYIHVHVYMAFFDKIFFFIDFQNCKTDINSEKHLVTIFLIAPQLLQGYIYRSRKLHSVAFRSSIQVARTSKCTNYTA